MAAYASLVSLSHILHHIQNPPPLNEIVIDKQQIEHLQEMVDFSIDFLETYSSKRSKEIQDLENQISIAAYAAEDIIESYVVGKIHPEKKSSRLFGQSVQKAIEKFLPRPDIQKVIKEFVLIQKKMEKIKSSRRMEDVRAVGSTGGSSSRSLPSAKNIMVGFDKHLNEVMAALATDESNRQVVPIVGMGGIGKTTLATAVYNDAYIVERFEFRAWVTVSQEYGEREIVLSLLHQVNINVEEGADELGILLHKALFGRRYLIVLDDMWDIQAWERLKKFLPESNNGSRVLVTTRLLNLALDFGSCRPYHIGLLDEEKSWDLIVEKVFAKEKCPDELEGIGKRIARKCGGLPLALVVIGGLLANSIKSREFWLHVEEDVTAAASSEDDERCRKILSSSYTHLPLHLKPCFLYLAIFPKNVEIRVSKLIRLWVAEGFIKLPSTDKSLEELAEECLGDLSDRNLIMVGQQGRSGKVKAIGIHDLIRDLCRREAHKNKFLSIANLDDPKIKKLHSKSERRLGIHVGTRKEKVCKVLRSSKLKRSFLSFSYWESRRCIARGPNLLRVLDAVDYYHIDDILQLINSRYIACAISRDFCNVSSIIALLWNLQTLIFRGSVSLPPEIWQMPQLRHLKMDRITLPDPPDARWDCQSIQVLENLQTLSTINDFIFRDPVLRKIPNLKKLGISCRITEQIESFCLTNLVSLYNLESLALAFDGAWRDMAFPISVKKLTLSYCRIPWEDMSEVGSLPKLEVLMLQSYAATGRIWKPHEGEFRRLKFLLIDSCKLEIWGAEASHFPILEQLHLKSLMLEEIPMDFAEIPTLEMINMNYCRSSLFTSAKEMSKEREDLGFENIQVRSFPSEAPLLRKDNVVGFEDEAATLLKYLNEETEHLDVISIIGMSGLGKTTLAGKLFHDKDIQYQFPTRIWVHVSQDFRDKDIFLSILRQMEPWLNEETYCKKYVTELAEEISGVLERGKFLIVMDDVWTTSDWDKLQIALPKSNKTGKILITSRQMGVGRYANRFRDPHMLRFLTLDESWLLLRWEVFGKPEFPPELADLGKEIASNCNGLPLAIVVIGGILVTKISTSYSAWEKVSKRVTTYLHEDPLGLMEKIISLSYENLPYHLRECFMYLGMFPEDFEIPTWKLICMWIAEGLIQHKDGISLEENAENYLDELINRNLVRGEKFKLDGKVKTCRVHDMIRDFCKNEGGNERENFLQEIKQSSDGVFHPPVDEVHKYRRLCIHSNILNFLSRRPYGPHVRSFVTFSEDIRILTENTSAIPAGFKLLRVLEVKPIKFSKIPGDFYHLVHLRYIALSFNLDFNMKPAILPTAFSKLWNIQTIIVDTKSRILDIEADIMNMIQLRHLKTNASATLLRPSKESKEGEKLQTLGTISPESCTEAVFDRARNLKKLGIRGEVALLDKIGSFDSLRKLSNLEKLKLINDVFPKPPSEGKLDGLPPAYKFPANIRSLTLSNTWLDWSQMSILGSLDNLHVLKVKDKAFMGIKWVASDRGFDSLEVLHIEHTNLTLWSAAGNPFPRLKRLELHNCYYLQEVPIELADIPSFQHLDLYHCEEAAASARKIEEKKKYEDRRAYIRAFKLSIFPSDTRDHS